MALLPSQNWIINQADGWVSLTKVGADDDEAIVSFRPADANMTAMAQSVIHFDAQLSDEDKCFAHFWSGYFHAYAVGNVG